MHDPDFVPEEPDEVQPDEESPGDKELNHLIDQWLAQLRPERYDPNDKEWMDDAVQRARDALLERNDNAGVIADAARRRVYQREGHATKRANKLLRSIYETGRLPLGWGEDGWQVVLFDDLRLPLSIGKTSRVRIGAAGPEDFTEWELESGREQDKWVEARMNARRGAQLVAAWLREQGARRFEDLRPPTPAGAGGE
jgi:hypothetical protein